MKKIYLLKLVALFVFCGFATFTSQNAYGQYCTTGLYSTGCTLDDRIDLVIFNTINNPTSNCPAGGFSDFTSISTSVQTGQPISITIGAGPFESQQFSVWIDLNNDQVFDASERLFATTTSVPTAFGQATGSITIPANTTPGPKRMRVRGQWSTAITAAQACSQFTWGETEDYTVNILAQSSTDAGISQILSPSTGCGLSSNSTVSVRLNNYGTSAISNVQVSYSVNGGTPVTEFFSATLAASSDTVYSFFTGANLSTSGTYTIRAWTSLFGDTIPLNDSANRSVISIPVVSTFPYLENFDAGAGGWIPGGANSTWALGTPAGTVINTAGSGANSWATNLAGFYSNNEQSFVTSPCFNLSTLTNPQVNLKVWWSSQTNQDGAILQASTDGGTTWTKVGAFGDPDNWYNQSNVFGVQSFGSNNHAWSGSGTSSSGGWLTARANLTGLAGQTAVRLRVAFGADGFTNNFDGFAFDDVVVQDPPATDVGVFALLSPNSGCGNNATTTVRVRIRNFGATAQSNIPVSFTVNGGAPVTEFFTGTIAAGSDTAYTFTATANLATQSTNNVVAYTGLFGDINPLNDTVVRTVTSIPTVSTFPYFQGFEAGSGGWVAGGALSSWALGTPAAPIISSAGGGTNSWVTNLTSNYNDGERSFVTSECFDFSSLTDPRIEMKVFWNSERNWDGAQLQVSTNGGNTWQNVGVFNDPNGENWYNSNAFSSTDVLQFMLNSSNWWSGRASSNNGSGGWVVAKNRLTGLAGQTSVRLRVAFASDGSVADEGFAFDDVLIQDPPANDAGVTVLVPPAFCPGPVTLSTRVRNFGAAPITSVNSTITVNGTPIGTAFFSGSLPPGQDTLLLVGSFTFAANTPYNIIAYTSSPNGSTDGNLFNDTLKLLNQFSSLAGVVTVGGTGADFPTLGALASTINSAGVCGPLNVQITGNTTETGAIVFNRYPGDFPITISPAGGSFTVSGSVAAGLVQLRGTRNITFDGRDGGLPGISLTLSNTSTAANTAVFWLRSDGTTSGVQNVTLRDMNIIGGSPTVTSSFGVYIGGNSISTFGTGANNDTVRIVGNRFTNAFYGVYARGITGTGILDSLIIRDNAFGLDSISFIGFRGLDIEAAAATQIVRNSFFLNHTAFSTISAIRLGFGTNDAFISANQIRRVRTSNTGGAYGISIEGGTNHVIVNNMVTGVLGTNNSNTSQFSNAFGIRLSGGSGHRVYYNSVNMHGAMANTSAVGGASAAFGVTSTAVNGLDVRNNIFANTMTSVSTGPVTMAAMWFVGSYSFATTNLNHNAYFIPNGSTTHHIGRIGTTTNAVTYSDLNAWRAISQVSNVGNDVNSQPSSNSLPPFISNDSLFVAPLTFTPAESAGAAVAFLGTPNVDITGANRPGGTGTAPDMGAVEFEGQTGDFIAPVVDTVYFTPIGNLCTATSRTVFAGVSDASGVDTVQILYTVGGVAQPPVSMTPAGFNLFSGVIPASGSNVVRFRIRAVDAAPAANNGFSGFLEYQDEAIGLGLSASTTTPTIVFGDSARVGAFSPLARQLKISEVVLFRGGTGQTTPYPSYIPAAAQDFVEISNVSSSSAAIGGIQIEIFGGGARTYTFPSTAVIPGNSVLVLHIGSGTDDVANRYFNTGGLSDSYSSGTAMGIVLRTTAGAIIDAVAINSQTFPPTSGVSASDWSGTGVSSPSGIAGTSLTGEDLNSATNWVPTSATPGSIGSYNAGLIPNPPTVVFTWSLGGIPIGTGAGLTFGPMNVVGINTFTVTIADSLCTASATVNVNVIAPAVPVAAFTATPLVTSTGQNVTFTDTSSNLPSAWNWSFNPSTVTFVNGTSATSQNPVVQFGAPGVYDVTLSASNASGSNSLTKTAYITVNISYCSVGVTFPGDTDIGNVTINNLNNGVGTPTLNNPTATGQYTDLTGTVAPLILVPDSSYAISVTQITGGSFYYAAYLNVFIDWNRNGLFTDPGERVFNAGPTSQTSPTLSGTIAVPNNASLGFSRMRVMLDEAGSATSGPCTTFSYGEVEDYLVEITTNPLGIAPDKNGPVAAMYPNPAQDRVLIQLKPNSRAQRIELLDIAGKTLVTQSVVGVEQSLVDFDLTKVPAGAYFVRVVAEDGISQRKLIKQ
jgi:hypothetical protein